jgi:hypothetical protein
VVKQIDMAQLSPSERDGAVQEVNSEQHTRYSLNRSFHPFAYAS